MNAFNRAFTVLVLGVAAAAFAAVTLTALGVGLPGSVALSPWLQDGLQRLAGLPPGARWGWGIMGALGVVACLGTVFLEFRFIWEVEPPLLLRSGSLGSVSVARGLVRRLAEREAEATALVRGARCEIKDGRRGLQLRCAVDVDPEAEIPIVSGEVQQRVGAAVARQLGLDVREVRVHVGSLGGKGERLARVA